MSDAKKVRCNNCMTVMMSHHVPKRPDADGRKIEHCLVCERPDMLESMKGNGNEVDLPD